jgi:hypothetical protein
MTRSEEFEQWVASARPGEWFSYHTGETVIGLAIQATVWAAAERGQVFLCQRRLTTDGVFEYRALRLDPQLGDRLHPARHGGVWQ